MRFLDGVNYSHGRTIMEDRISLTHDSPTCEVHPGRLYGSRGRESTRPTQRCVCCGWQLMTVPSQGAILSMHLQQSPKCLASYVARKDFVGIDDSGLVIVSTLHACTTESGCWVVKGVLESGRLATVAKCRDRRDAMRVLVMFCVRPLAEEIK